MVNFMGTAGEEIYRLNKYLSMAGVCSRREADRAILDKRVTVNGSLALAGTRVRPGDTVCFDGKVISLAEPVVLLLFHKPRGIVCSTKQQFDEVTVTDYIRYPCRIYPVGRLDKDSEGLLLLTNQGELMNRILKAENHHEKEYLVTLDRPFDDQFLAHMRKGVPILSTVTRPCTVQRLSANRFRIILTQGLNRQIRRMCSYLGYQVVKLKRVRIMNIKLGALPCGSYREATAEEMKELLIEANVSPVPVEKRMGG